MQKIDSEREYADKCLAAEQGDAKARLEVNTHRLIMSAVQLYQTVLEQGHYQYDPLGRATQNLWMHLLVVHDGLIAGAIRRADAIEYILSLEDESADRHELSQQLRHIQCLLESYQEMLVKLSLKEPNRCYSRYSSPSY